MHFEYNGTDFRAAFEKHPFPYSMARPHYHNEPEIFVLTGGSRKFSFPTNIDLELTYPSILFIAPKTPHRAMHIEKNGYEKIETKTDWKVLESLGLPSCIKQELYGENFFCLYETTNEKIQYIKQIFENANSYSAKYKDFGLKLCILNLMIIISESKLILKKAPMLSENLKKSIDIMDYITNNISVNYSVTDIADFFNYTPQSLSALIKKYSGMSIKNFITNEKINSAAWYLKNTNLSVEEISYKVGYENSNYFGDFFKKKTGLSPKNFQKAYREK